MREKSLRGCALGENGTHEIDFNRHEDNLPSHRGHWIYEEGVQSITPTTPSGRVLGNGGTLVSYRSLSGRGGLSLEHSTSRNDQAGLSVVAALS